MEFDLLKAWFKNRVKGYDLGGLVLKEEELIITFKKPVRKGSTVEYIGWDLNLYSLDGFSPKHGWIKPEPLHSYS